MRKVEKLKNTKKCGKMKQCDKKEKNEKIW